ncbi:MAG: DUF4832 domain-containing protein [Lachnospiraceae bacterium]|nr:DUF4832 domain-containing protein [Lachnospiraceae bacterium]
MKKALPVLIILFLIFGSGLYLFGIRPVFSYVPEEYHETDASLSNPYEGMYRIYTCKLSDENPFSTKEIASELSQDPYRLSLLEVNLSEYSEGDISEKALSQFNDVLSVFDAGRHDLILRLLYDQEGDAKHVEPKKVEIVRDHILALTPIINHHAGCIFTLQGVLIGDYGEMHNSRLISDDNLTMLTDLMYSHTDNSIYLAVRTPAYWRLITKSDDPATDHGLTARLGLYNDGLFGSEDDMGTYVLRPRDNEYNFQSILCNHVPNGGEVVVENDLNDYENARLELRKLHITYLNSEYDPMVLNKWKRFTELTDPVWRGHSGYEYIENHLGYRYYLSYSGAVVDNSLFSTEMSFRITLKNRGFAPAYRPFKGYLRLHPTGRKAGDDIILDVPTDFSTLLSEETRSVDIPAVGVDFENSDYEVWFYIVDETSGERILTANDNVVNSELKLGTISCRSLLKK